MPKHVIKLVLHTLEKTGKTVKSSKIAILGTAYKADVDDSREAHPNQSSKNS